MDQHMVKVSISQLRHNPFRELDDFPLDRDKIDKLKESIASTGFWGTIVARKKSSTYEIAFGHHRKAALEELQTEGIIGKTEKVDIIVRELTNEEMIQLMARENLEEWSTNAAVEAETVATTIKAYGEGKIQLPPLDPKTRDDAKRHVDHAGGPHVYTKLQVAEFIGWTRKKGGGDIQPNHCCEVAFDMLDAFDAGIITKKSLKGLNRDVAREIVAKAIGIKKEQERIAKQREQEATKAQKMAEQESDERKARSLMRAADELERQAEVAKEAAISTAKDFATDVIKRTKSGNLSQRDIRDEGDKRKEDLRSKKEQNHKTASQHYEKLKEQIASMLNPASDERFKDLRGLLKIDCGLTQKDIDLLKKTVADLITRAGRFANELGSWKPKASDSLDSPRSKKLVGVKKV